MSDWFSKCGSCCQQYEIFLNVVTHCIVQVLHVTLQFLHQTVGLCWLSSVCLKLPVRGRRTVLTIGPRGIVKSETVMEVVGILMHAQSSG